MCVVAVSTEWCSLVPAGEHIVVHAVQSFRIVVKVAHLAQLILGNIVLSSAGNLPFGVRVAGDRTVAVRAKEFIAVYGSGKYLGVYIE